MADSRDEAGKIEEEEESAKKKKWKQKQNVMGYEKPLAKYGIIWVPE